MVSLYTELDLCTLIIIAEQREIMLFIGKPKGRSMMISNATNYYSRANRASSKATKLFLRK